MNFPHRILIFGATSAIAQATARRLLQQGCDLHLIGRNQTKLQTIIDDLKVRAAPTQKVSGEAADLDNLADFPHLFDTATAALGSIDAVLIAHGNLPDQKVCETNFSNTLAALHTNGISAIALADEAARRMLIQGYGLIAAISSVAGDRGRQSNYVYGTAKGMLNIYLQGLRNRLAPSGISVMTIKPGFVDTPMTAAFEKKGILWASADDIARGIISAMHKRRDIVYLPWFWCGIMFIIRAIPDRVFKKLKL